MYSYSNAGAWILAGILETLHRQPYDALLRRDLLEPLALQLQHVSPGTPSNLERGCPAMGGTLALSVRAALEFLRAEAFDPARVWPSPATRGPEGITSYPGWNALERGIHHGWKFYGRSWFGHNSIWPGASIMVRVHPPSRRAIVIASAYQHASLVGAKLFADELPDYKDLRFPTPLPADAAAQLDLQRYAGSYWSTRECFTVGITADHRLRLDTSRSGFALIPATDDLFFVHSAAPGHSSFIQFAREDEAGFQYLWDGRRLFRRW
jgi:hypothetical protein